MSISITFNMPILAMELSSIVKERFFFMAGEVFFIAISSTWLCEEVGRKSRHFMCLGLSQYGSIFFDMYINAI